MGGIFPSVITKIEWSRCLLPLSKSKMVIVFNKGKDIVIEILIKMHLWQFKAEYFQLVLYI